MSDDYLYALPRLSLVPTLTKLGLHVTREYSDPDSLTLEDTLEAPRHVDKSLHSPERFFERDSLPHPHSATRAERES